MSDDRDFRAIAPDVERLIEIHETQAELSDDAQASAELGAYDGFSAGSGGRDPGMLPNEETAERYVPLSMPRGPASYHQFAFGERDIDRYWNALSAIDENLIATHAAFWRHAEQALSHHSSILFHRKSAIEDTFRGDTADLLRERIGAVRFSMDEWWSAAGWIAGKLELLAADISWRKTRLFPIWQHYRWMLMYAYNWPSDRAMVIYDPAAPDWTPDWPLVLLPNEPGSDLLGDMRWSEYYEAAESPGFLLVDGGRGTDYVRGATTIAERYHEHAARLVQPLAEKMVDVHQEIYTRTPVQFYGHSEPGEVPPDLLMPDIPMPGLATPEFSGVGMPSTAGFGGGGVPGSVPANLPAMPAGIPGTPGYNPSDSPFVEQLAQLGQPGEMADLSAGLPDNGELALMPEALLPGVSPGGLPPGTGAGPGAGVGLPPVLGGGPVPSLVGAGPRAGFAPGSVGASVTGVSPAGVAGASRPNGVPDVNGVGGVGGVPGVDAIPGASGVPSGSGVAGVDGVPGANGVPSANGVGSTQAAPAALSGAASGSLAAGAHGGLGMMPPPMMPPMMPPMAGQPARREGQAGQGGEGGAAVPPGMPGMFVPPGTVSQRGSSPTAPQPRPATLPGAARTASRRPGLGRLGGMAQAGRPAAPQPAAPAAAGRAPEQTTAADQEMWRVRKAKGSLPGSTPQQPAPQNKPAATAG